MSKRWEKSSQGMLAVNSILAGFCVTATSLILTLGGKSIFLELSLGFIAIAFILFVIGSEWITDALDYQEINDYIQSMFTYNLGVLVLFIATGFLFIHYGYYILALIPFFSMCYWIHHLVWLFNSENRKQLTVDITCVIQRVSVTYSNEIIEDLMRLEAFFPEHLQESHREIKSTIQNPENICLIAVIDNIIEGYLLAGPLKNFSYIPGVKDAPQFSSDNCMYIMSIIVSPRYRGKGIGRSLNNELHRIAKSQEYKYISAHTKEGTYLRKGMKFIGKFPNWYGGQETYEYWQREVPSANFLWQH